MTKKLVLLVTSAMLMASATAGESTNRLSFPIGGFSIAPLETPQRESTQQALIMCLPATDGFAANVNVQIQPYTGTVGDYVALTLQQFKTAGLKVLQQTVTVKSVAYFEYSGEMQGRSLHWYARVEKSGGAVFLATATATPEQWIKEGARLKTCVDSFLCDAGEPGAPPRR
jgi:hypothetical protein